MSTTGATGDIIGDESYSDYCGETIALVSIPLLLDDPVISATFSIKAASIAGLDVTTPRLEIFYRFTNHGGSCPAVTVVARCSTWTSLGTVTVDETAAYKTVNLTSGQVNGGGEMQFMVKDASVFSSGSGYQQTRVTFSEASGTGSDPRLTILYNS